MRGGLRRIVKFLSYSCAFLVEGKGLLMCVVMGVVGDEDLDNAPGNYSAFGLPVLNSTEQGTRCGSSSMPSERACRWKGISSPLCRWLCMVADVSPDFFASWPRKDPVYAPFTTPVYSNVGYALLGLVIERVTGLSFAEYLHEAILKPLELNRTSVNGPLSLGGAFITAETGDGDLDLGFEARYTPLSILVPSNIANDDNFQFRRHLLRHQ